MSFSHNEPRLSYKGLRIIIQKGLPRTAENLVNVRNSCEKHSHGFQCGFSIVYVWYTE